MIKTYIRVDLSSEGESPKMVIERMRQIGAVPVVGDFDFELPLKEDERLFDRLEDIHHALRGSHVRYSITTRTDFSEVRVAGDRAGQVSHVVDQRPVELRKKLYRDKLERWKEMGLDVETLEDLLEQDLDKFKEVSKDFLRTHLNSVTVVRDKLPPENLVDGEVLSLIDEQGKTISDLMALTGYSEEQVTLSLGRLISAGSTVRGDRGSDEVYRLVPPPAPPTRTQLKTLAASTDEEAEDRIMASLRAKGSSKAQLIRGSRLPPEQAVKAIAALSKEGKLRVVRKGDKAVFYPA